ncbi:MAG: hypothetical protein M0Q47_10890 [Methanothrix sp.]|uniref:hypothetical protein n=2 Tax=Methanothrix sp. TaxID=90426 RepID=UPI0025F507B5|nr:hypothetical protein [Methanothrix sp.]MCK9406899.1 hypothetical protein [Methanothrix sp.]
MNLEEWNLENMREIPGWEGPVILSEGACRYSKYISWIRLFINVQIDEEVGGGRIAFSGGAVGDCPSFEVKRENGQWMRYEVEMAWTPKGEPVLRLRNYSCWDLVYDRISDGTQIDEKIETIYDLAEYLERCLP